MLSAWGGRFPEQPCPRWSLAGKKVPAWEAAHAWGIECEEVKPGRKVQSGRGAGRGGLDLETMARPGLHQDRGRHSSGKRQVGSGFRREGGSVYRGRKSGPGGRPEGRLVAWGRGAGIEPEWAAGMEGARDRSDSVATCSEGSGVRTDAQLLVGDMSLPREERMEMEQVPGREAEVSSVSGALRHPACLSGWRYFPC